MPHCIGRESGGSRIAKLVTCEKFSSNFVDGFDTFMPHIFKAVVAFGKLTAAIVFEMDFDDS
jgi:hypothetical protein